MALVIPPWQNLLIAETGLLLILFTDDINQLALLGLIIFILKSNFCIVQEYVSIELLLLHLFGIPSLRFSLHSIFKQHLVYTAAAAGATTK